MVTSVTVAAVPLEVIIGVVWCTTMQAKPRKI